MRRALLVAAALALAAPAHADDGWQVRHEASVSVEGALDDNPGRSPAGSTDAEPADALAYLFANGSLDARRGHQALHVEGEAGSKLFTSVHAEDLVALRVLGSWGLRVTHGLVLSLEASYKDKFQRGLSRLDLPDDAEAPCTPPEGVRDADYRCLRRDYRSASGGLDADVRLAPALSLRLSVGASLFVYKPHPWFTYYGPQATATLRWRLSRAFGATVFAGGALRDYPDSPTFELVPSVEGRRTAVARDAPRREQVYSGGLTVSWRGPLLVDATWILASSVNNGDAMDVLRNRFELAAAVRLGPRTTLVASAALQLAHWPEGNVFRQLLLIADESEQQNALALKVSHHMSESLALVVKFQAYSNEFTTASADALPFARRLFQTGVEMSF